MLNRFPHLAQVPPDAPQGIDSILPLPPPIEWNKLGELIPLHPAEENDGGEIPSAEDDVTCTWHDVALSIAAELMAKIREDVHHNLGYTMSAVRTPWYMILTHHKFISLGNIPKQISRQSQSTLFIRHKPIHIRS